MSLRDFVQMGQILIGNVRDGLVHGCLYPWEATSTGGVYNVREEWSVVPIVCYVHDELYPLQVNCSWWIVFFGSTFTHSLTRSFTQDKSGIYIWIGRTSSGLLHWRTISTIYYIFVVRSLRQHIPITRRGGVREGYTLLCNIRYLIWWNVFTQ